MRLLIILNGQIDAYESWLDRLVDDNADAKTIDIEERAIREVKKFQLVLDKITKSVRKSSEPQEPPKPKRGCVIFLATMNLPR